MNKKLAGLALVGAFVLAFVVGQATSSKNDSKDNKPAVTTTTAPAPTTTTTQDNSYAVSKCDDLFNQYKDASLEFADLVQNATPFELLGSAAKLKEVADAGADTGRTLLSTCSSYFTGSQRSAVSGAVDAYVELGDTVDGLLTNS